MSGESNLKSILEGVLLVEAALVGRNGKMVELIRRFDIRFLHEDYVTLFKAFSRKELDKIFTALHDVDWSGVKFPLSVFKDCSLRHLEGLKNNKDLAWEIGIPVM